MATVAMVLSSWPGNPKPGSTLLLLSIWFGPAIVAALAASWLSGRRGGGFARGAGIGVAAAVVGGKLSVDTSKLPFLAPRQVATEIRRFVDELNARLAATGKALGSPSIGPDGLTLTKVPLASA